MSIDHVQLPGTGAKIETISQGDGEKRQVVAIRGAGANDEDVIGARGEEAPETDTAPAGLNGRLQRLALRLAELLDAIQNIEISAPEGGATEAKQDALIAAVENLELPAPEGGATEATLLAIEGVLNAIGSVLSGTLTVSGTVASEIAELAPISGAVAITPHDDDPVTPGRQLLIRCTEAGDVALVFADDSALTLGVDVGTTVLPWAVKKVLVTGTTATATYANLV